MYHALVQAIATVANPATLLGYVRVGSVCFPKETPDQLRREEAGGLHSFFVSHPNPVMVELPVSGIISISIDQRFEWWHDMRADYERQITRATLLNRLRPVSVGGTIMTLAIPLATAAYHHFLSGESIFEKVGGLGADTLAIGAAHVSGIIAAFLSGAVGAIGSGLFAVVFKRYVPVDVFVTPARIGTTFAVGHFLTQWLG